MVASSQALTSQSEDGESLSGEEDERGGGEMGEGCGAVRGKGWRLYKRLKEIYVEVSAGKGNHSKWNINESIFLPHLLKEHFGSAGKKITL